VRSSGIVFRVSRSEWVTLSPTIHKRRWRPVAPRAELSERHSRGPIAWARWSRLTRPEQALRGNCTDRFDVLALRRAAGGPAHRVPHTNPRRQHGPQARIRTVLSATNAPRRRWLRETHVSTATAVSGCHIPDARRRASPSAVRGDELLLRSERREFAAERGFATVETHAAWTEMPSVWEREGTGVIATLGHASGGPARAVRGHRHDGRP
jgi:hypothetical protein